MSSLIVAVHNTGTHFELHDESREQPRLMAVFERGTDALVCERGIRVLGEFETLRDDLQRLTTVTRASEARQLATALLARSLGYLDRARVGDPLPPPPGKSAAPGEAASERLAELTEALATREAA